MAARKGVIAAASGAAAAALIVGVSVVWPGLDAQQTPPVDPAVWALNSDSSRYARVNTAIGELDTVRSVANANSIVQASHGAFLFSDTNTRLTKIDEALPADLDQATLRTSPSTPSGTQDVATSGDYVVYRTDQGAVHWADVASGAATQINPYADDEPTPTATPTGADAEATEDAEAEKRPDYAATAVAVNDEGMVFAYSEVDHEVMRYSIRDARVVGTDTVTGVGDAPHLTAVGDTWVLYDDSTQQVWERGVAEAQQLEATGSTVYLARTTLEGDATFLADEAGLIRIPLDGADPQRVVGRADVDLGTPARPTPFQGQMYAGWLGTENGTLWRSDKGETTLDYAGSSLLADRSPRFTATESAMILNEARKGWVWTMPDGELLPSSQDWDLDKPADQNAEQSDVQAIVVLDPKPPVAEPDAFGVRAGAIATLPVLLNDHDPNTDVLSIDPNSITQVDPEFGTVSLTDDGTRLAINVAAGATGEASFTYRVSDGTTADGLYSEATTVTVSVVPPTENRPPAWCGVEDCLTPAPAAEVKPGGTVTVPVLNGWVDPDGDPLLVLSVNNPTGIGAAAVTQRGEVVYQHPDPAKTDGETIDLDVVVADTTGATTQKPLRIKVTESPELTAKSFTVMDTIAVDHEIDVAPHVTGTVGSLSLESVRVLGDANAQATVNPGTTLFDFAAKDPGTYRVAYTVTDGSAKVDGTTKITLLAADAPAQLAASPVVAFVRPQEDATIDVFQAVTNPTRRVLMLSEVRGVADDGATMQVDTVENQFLRVTGSTGTGEPGRLGVVKYRVSDGSGSAAAQIEGQATVYLLPATDDLAPIAVDDTVTVRTRAQVDIPVLGNDVSPSGAALTLDPSSVKSSSDDGLAFASERVVRYLAPSKPGTYTVDYGVYGAGTPSRLDTGRVTITVIGDEVNREPRPRLLEGRVLAGQTTTIPFDTFGVDPDGDEVVIDRIMTQPKSGSASIASDGEGIVYASAPGTKGQFSFTYRVLDALGKSKIGTVRVGVLDQVANPSPVTFTDYVQVQIGADNEVNLAPLQNDLDPTGGVLTLTDVTPNLAEKLDDDTVNPQYKRWASMITREKDEDTIVIEAGTEPGTMSFLYRVESETGNTAIGLIVVKMVRESVPDYPVVADTILTVETRDQFATGVDVLDGKVSWTGGSAASLKLGLWDQQSGIEQSGTKLSGTLPEKPRIIAFSVSGKANDGTPVTSYGFLRVPGEDDKSISLRAGIQPLDVKERESISFDMNTLIAVPRGAEVEFNSKIPTWGSRAEASCSLGNAGTVTYSAGEGAPWTDACQVPVRLVGQEDWTVLSVPIRVTALDPIPVLKPASLTVQPGAEATFDLRTMVSWEGREDWDNLAYSVQPPGGEMEVTQQGGKVTVRAADTAIPGNETVAVIGVTSHPNVATSNLVLRVGASPNIQPKAGTVEQSCSQAQGTSCSVQVTGAPGEVNPLPGTPLRLTAVGNARCVGVTFAVADENTVTATWTADTPGGTCQVPFTLIDAQERTTSGDRAGTILFDLRGFPRAPSSITQVRYADGKVGLQVDPGAARDSYPAVTGFSVTSGGEVVATCSADGSCPDISSANGEKRTFEAVAINEVGPSRTKVAGIGWAYRPPLAPTGITPRPVPNGNEGGKIELDVSGIDAAQTEKLIISAPGAESLTIGISASQLSLTSAFMVGSNRAVPVTVTPVSRFQVPPVPGGGSTTGEVTTVQANGIGAPTAPSLTAGEPKPVNATQSTVRLTAAATEGGDGGGLSYHIVRAGQDCSEAPDKAVIDVTLTRNAAYDFQTCIVSTWQGQTFGSTTASTSVKVFAEPPAPTDWTFQVSPDPVVETRRAFWKIAEAPTGKTPDGYTSEVGGFPSDTFGADPGIRVRVTSSTLGNSSPWGDVKPKKGSAPEQTALSWRIPECRIGEVVVPEWSADASKQPTVTFDWTDAVYTLKGNKTEPAVSGEPVPDKATKITGVTMTVDWSKTGWNLDGLTSEMSATCGN